MAAESILPYSSYVYQLWALYQHLFLVVYKNALPTFLYVLTNTKAHRTEHMWNISKVLKYQCTTPVQYLILERF